MYYYLHGLITMHTRDRIIVECHGVGYDILVAHPDEFPIGEMLFVFTCYFSNENEQYLVGFKTLEEKKLFEALISVKGIGPKTALNALGSTSSVRLKMAIDDADQNFLMKLPGIGKKNAGQIILDLKGKLDDAFLSLQEEDKNLLAAKDALKSLGFKENEIKEAMKDIAQRGLTMEEYTRLALRNLKK